MKIWRWQSLQRGGGVTELDFTSADGDDDGDGVIMIAMGMVMFTNTSEQLF